MAVAGSGVIPRKATLEAPALPANRRSRRQPLAGRGTQYRSRRTTPRSHHRTPAPGPFARSDAPSRARAGRYFVVERAPCGARTDRSSDMQVRLATPAGAGDRYKPMQSSGRPTPRDSIRGRSGHLIVPGTPAAPSRPLHKRSSPAPRLMLSLEWSTTPSGPIVRRSPTSTR